MELIHISFAGPDYWLSAGGKIICFEDHRACGPIVLGKNGDPLTVQPPEKHPFWKHVTAWYQQGKKFEQIGNKRWCRYETALQSKRREARAAASMGGQSE